MSVLWLFCEHSVTIIIPCFPEIDTRFRKYELDLLSYFLKRIL